MPSREEIKLEALKHAVIGVDDSKLGPDWTDAVVKRAQAYYEFLASLTVSKAAPPSAAAAPKKAAKPRKK